MACSARQQPGAACEECRRRKARCDRGRPQCGICAETGRACAYVSNKSQRGPKKGHLKDLRSRVAMLEERLVTQDKALKPDVQDVPRLESDETTPERETLDEPGSPIVAEISMDVDSLQILEFPSGSTISEPPDSTTVSGLVSPCTFTTNIQSFPFTPMSPGTRQMSTVGEGKTGMSDLMQANLDLIYFERVHPVAPIVHKRRYFSWANEANPSPARLCLRSAMRTVAAAMSAQAPSYGDDLYATTRHMLEMQDVHVDTGLPWMTRTSGQQAQIEHERIQAWLLLAYYDFLRKPEHQAHLTAGRAFRLLHLSRLFDLDAHDGNASTTHHSPLSSTSSPTLQAVPDEGWIELEEKRRTLWTAFVLDRLSSMLNDRPLMLHEEMICTRLPMPEEDFQNSQYPIRMGFLPETLSKYDGCGTLPTFAECVVLANLFGRRMAHRRLTQSLSNGESNSQDFWTRHEWLAAVAATATMTRHPSQSPNTAPDGEFVIAKCNVMSSFNRILAHCACICLSNTAEASSWQSLDDHLMAISYKHLAHQAAYEVVKIIKSCPRIAFFKMHPFLPNAISLVVSFLEAPASGLESLDEGRLEGINQLLCALRCLSDVNNLASEQVYKLEADIAQSITSTLEIATPEWTL